ncbi:MAG: hypothetical protein ACK4TF_04540 [Thermodesulfovibrionales bacterium]
MPVKGIGEKIHQAVSVRSEKKGQDDFSFNKVHEKDYTVNLRKESLSLKDIDGIKTELHDSLRLLKEDYRLNDLIERISENLFSMNKVFPPYPPGSEERVKMLKSLTGFRILIERLTVPPEQKEEVIRLSADQAELKSIHIKNSLSMEKSGVTADISILKEL